MSDINVQLVRELFELNGFRTMLSWPSAGAGQPERSPQLFVENSDNTADDTADFLLEPANLPSIERAVVEVRAWHADRFYPSVIEANPVICQFAGEQGRLAAAEHFGTPEFSAILVISELPQSAEPRARALELFQAGGIDYLLEFPAMLRGIQECISSQGQYEGSPTLQLMRLLKRYRMTRRQQLEFLFDSRSTLGE